MSNNDQIIRYQWMRNAEGGQSFGNKMEIRPLTNDAFFKYIAPRLRPGFANSLAEYQKKVPDQTHYCVIWRVNDSDWQFSGVGSKKELMETAEKTSWAIKVNDFSSKTAKDFGSKADSQ